jgi:prepilin-type N-terminal cleavage/methylation domain-containing protein
MKNTRPGFTLLEVTLVIGILAIMLSLTLVISYNAITSSSLRAAENILVQMIRRAQTLSQNNIDGSQWGVYICDAASLSVECSSAPEVGIVLYSRATFTAFNAATDQLFEFNPQIVLSGSLYDSMSANPSYKGITFAKFTGDPVESGWFPGTIIMTRNEEARSLTINIRGVVDH